MRSACATVTSRHPAASALRSAKVRRSGRTPYWLGASVTSWLANKQPAVAPHRLGDEVRNALAPDRCLFQRVAFQHTEIGNIGIHAGYRRTTGIVSLAEIALGGERYVAVRIGEISDRDVADNALQEAPIAIEIARKCLPTDADNRRVGIGVAGDLVAVGVQRLQLFGGRKPSGGTGLAAIFAGNIEGAAGVKLFEQRGAGRARRCRRVVERERDQRPRIAHRQFFRRHVARQEPRQLPGQHLIRRFSEARHTRQRDRHGEVFGNRQAGVLLCLVHACGIAISGPLKGISACRLLRPSRVCDSAIVRRSS